MNHMTNLLILSMTLTACGSNKPSTKKQATLTQAQQSAYDAPGVLEVKTSLVSLAELRALGYDTSKFLPLEAANSDVQSGPSRFTLADGGIVNTLISTGLSLLKPGTNDVGPKKVAEARPGGVDVSSLSQGVAVQPSELNAYRKVWTKLGVEVMSLVYTMQWRTQQKYHGGTYLTNVMFVPFASETCVVCTLTPEYVSEDAINVGTNATPIGSVRILLSFKASFGTTISTLDTFTFRADKTIAETVLGGTNDN